MKYFQRFQFFFLHNILVEIQWNSKFIEFHQIVSSYNSWRVKLEFHERTTFAPKASRFSFFALLSIARWAENNWPSNCFMSQLWFQLAECFHLLSFNDLPALPLCVMFASTSVYDYPLLMHASSHNVYWDTQTPASSPYARITRKKSSWFSIHTCDDHYH